jgi:hypothetical protein
MPPEENKNKNLESDTLRINVDPIFTGGISKKETPAETNISAGVSGVLNNQQYSPSETPKPISVTPEIKKTEGKSIVRTYKDDIEAAIKENHLSSINIAVAENEKNRNREKDKLPDDSNGSNYSRNKLIIFISLFLIVVGIAGVGITYLIKNKGNTTITTPQILSSFITTEYKDELKTDTVIKGKFINALSSRLNDTQIPVNNLYNIYLTTTSTSTTRKILNSNDFIKLAGFKMPDIIKRTILPDFMVGMFSFGENFPFIIFRSSYFENAYAGMLDWEKDLEKDVQVLFRLSGYENSGNILSELSAPNTKKFEDLVIVNKNVRLIRNEKGEIILLYAIIDKETIIITVNERTFKEIVDRLNKEKGLKR